MRRITAITVLSAILLAPAAAVLAHHSVLNYDGKRVVTITGTVTSARFGYPHSVYRIDVEADDGTIEKWTLSTEDPRDAERLGFADAIRNLKRGDRITVLGWPDKHKKNTLRGHQLHYPDGTIVMMRRGNYIWPQDILRMDRMALNPQTIPASIASTDQALSPAEQLLGWIAEDNHLARIAREYADGRPRLIGLAGGTSTDFPGVDDLLQCHTRRDDFTMRIPLDDIDANSRARINAAAEYVSEYNRVLSRWWEQEKESCE